MTRRLVPIAIVLGLGITASVFSQNGPRVPAATATALVAAQPAEEPICPRPEDGGKLWTYEGNASCQRCHAKEDGIAARLFDPEDWVPVDTYDIWHKKDLHQQAYAVLLNPRSLRMAEVLKKAMPAEQAGNYEVHRDKRCLACHSGYSPELDSDPDTMLYSPNGAPQYLVEGVGCEACHGPGGNRDGRTGWGIKHAAPDDKWRTLDPDTKWTEYGYFDVRSPLRRMRLCASCHIGNASEGRVVTHEMYAAGHPPLPGFELDTFERDEPKHWMELADKNAAIVAKFIKETKDPRFSTSKAVVGDRVPFELSDLNDSKAVLTSSLVGLAETMRLNAELATDAYAGPLDKGQEIVWPELAQFDCYACHHDLADSGWRYRRQPVLSRPGRPTIREWPEALPLVAARVAGRMKVGSVDELQKALEANRALVGQVPFGGVGGDANTFARSACNVAEAADRLAEAIDEKGMPYAGGPDLLKDIVAVALWKKENGEPVYWDYDSARQLTWAFDSVLVEMDAHNRRKDVFGWKGIAPLPQGAALRKLIDDHVGAELPAIEMSYAEPEERKTDDEKLQAVLDRIDRETAVRGRLEALAAYDALEFRAAFEKIAAELGVGK